VEQPIDLTQSHEWKQEGDQPIEIPPEVVRDLKMEVVVMHPKKDFSFQCRFAYVMDDGSWSFDHVVIDTSIRNDRGELVQTSLSYHPSIKLVNVPVMIIPVPEKDDDNEETS